MEINISILKPDMFWDFMKKQSLNLDREFRMTACGFITPLMTSCFCLKKKKNYLKVLHLKSQKYAVYPNWAERLVPYSVLIITNDHKVRFGLTKLFLF